MTHKGVKVSQWDDGG